MKLPLTSLSVTTKDLDVFIIISRVEEQSILEKKGFKISQQFLKVQRN